MLRVREIRDLSPGTTEYRVDEDGHPAPLERLGLVAAAGNRLLEENELAGSFRAPQAGRLELSVPEGIRGYFHDGIVFAALDVINDPVRNPTLSRFPPS